MYLLCSTNWPAFFTTNMYDILQKLNIILYRMEISNTVFIIPIYRIIYSLYNIHQSLGI